MSKELTAFAAAEQLTASDWALFGGEDYRLLVTIEAQAFEDIKAAFQKKFQKPIYSIGTITQDEQIILLSEKGKQTPLDPSGYDHFK